MRIRRLELARYGGWSERVLDFGAVPEDGRPDLHVILGPNEAGKSTLLAAIGDLLFGFGPRTEQDWMFPAKELRLRATLEHAGKSLSVVRRKGTKNTLLGEDETPLADDALVIMLGGVDRPAFESMFGLDHAGLRAGGRAILEGRDDASRTIFEAGTGLRAVGEELKRLQARCDGLFKPSASVPEVNRLLRERGEALKSMREATLGDTELTAILERRDAAGRRRDALVEEARTLAARDNLLDRVARARAPLARLANARAEVEALGPLPSLPADAGASLEAARRDRATAAELRAAHGERMESLARKLAEISPSETLIAARSRIGALSTRMIEVDKGRRDLPRRRALLERIDAALAGARERLRVGADASLPSDGWRRRARAHLETWRALQARVSHLADELAEASGEQGRAQAELAALADVTGLDQLEEALAEVPADAEQKLAGLAAQAKRAQDAAAAALGSLGWKGSAETLAAAPLPPPEDGADHARRIETALEDLRSAHSDFEASSVEIAARRARLEELARAGELPTREAVEAARRARNATLETVRGRLRQRRAEDDSELGLALREEIARADLLADRRDAEAQRVAEHGLEQAALVVAAEKAASASRSRARAEEGLREAQESWAGRAAEAGLPASLKPSTLEPWREARGRALAAHEAAALALAESERARAAHEAAMHRLAEALACAGAPPPGQRTAREAKAQAARLQGVARARATLLARQAELARRDEALGRESAAIGRTRGELEDGRKRLVAEAGLGEGDAGPTALEDALATLDDVWDDMVARPAAARDVESITGDIDRFAKEAAVLLGELGRDVHGPPEAAMHALSADLAKAVDDQQVLVRLNSEAERAAGDYHIADRRLTAADSTISDLMRLAGVESEEALATLLEKSERMVAARQSEAETLRELAAICEGRPLETLEVEAGAIDPDAAAAERAAIQARRDEIAEEREGIGGQLADASSDLASAATSTRAADANQTVAQIQAALAAAAERFVEASSAAAVLRWLVQRHRQSAQAPLLARAGELFAVVTRGEFARLILEYGDDDRARIAAVRADGSPVGVEGLSEGTLDQLFLSLRLGSLETRRSGATPEVGAPPLVCDDLLVTSDPQRTAAILGVLAEVAARSQVLVFTHHDFVVDVAARALGPEGFRTHRLAPAASKVAA